MSEAQRKLHRYFDRLCHYCAISALFTFAAAFNMPEYVIFMLLFMVPHSLFFILTEIKMHRALYIAAQMLGVLAFSWIIFHVSPHQGALLILLLFLYFIFSTAMFGSSREEAGVSAVGIFAVVLNISAIVILSLMAGGAEAGTTRGYELLFMYGMALPVFLINLGLALVSRFLCKYFIGLDLMTHPFIWRQTETESSEKSVERVAKRSQMYTVLFVCAIVLAALSLTARHHSEEAIYSIFAAREQDFEFDDIFFDIAWAPFELFEAQMDVPDEPGEEMAAMPDEAAEIAELSEPDTRFDYLWAAILLLFLIILPILISGIRRVKKVRGEILDDEGLIETEYTEKSKARTAKRMLFSANNAIRAIFRRKVNDYRKRGLFIKTSDTARIISEGINKNEDITTLSELYHKARYSGKQLTGGDVAMAGKKKKS